MNPVQQVHSYARPDGYNFTCSVTSQAISLKVYNVAQQCIYTKECSRTGSIGRELQVAGDMKQALSALVLELSVELSVDLSAVQPRMDSPTEAEAMRVRELIENVDRRAFGSKDWKNHFGLEVDNLPPPPCLKSILQETCPFFPNKKVEDTHVLVFIPNKINDCPMSLNALIRFANESDNQKLADCVKELPPDIKNEIGDIPISSSGWVLMTRSVIPDSKNKTYDAQRALFSAHQADCRVDYSLPSCLESFICVLATFLKFGDRLFFETSNTFPYTRCAETMQGKFPVCVGPFTNKGLSVFKDKYDSDYYDFTLSGVVGIRRVPVGGGALGF
ncbi:MAG: hypothetical protein S4CHLAM2_03530 [Chlamydiales bacterium]|nr:hypothetical protein [Chlamydiales bacterium]